jgi:hypothetical protein
VSVAETACYVSKASRLTFLGLAPKGLQGSAQGFNPGNPENGWFAL